jgi:hypothetical protein
LLRELRIDLLAEVTDVTDTTHRPTPQRQRPTSRRLDQGRALEIRPVTGRSDLPTFIRLPWQLYISDGAGLGS